MSESQPPLPPAGDGVPSSAGPHPAGPHPAGPYAGAPSAGPYTGGPYVGGPYAGGPYASGPYTGGSYTGGPYTGGPAAGASAGTAGGSPPVGATTATGFFDSIRGAGMVRPDDRVAAGVAAAVAGRMRVDPLLVRVGLVVLALVGGIGVLAYGLGWLLLPQQDGRIHAQALLAGSVTAGTVGAGLTTLIGLGVIGPPWAWGEGPAVGGLIALASIVLLIVLFVVGNQQGWFGGSRPPTAPGPGPATGTTADPTSAAPQTTGPSGLGATRIDLSKPRDTPWAPQATTPYAGSPVPPGPPPPPVPFVPPVPPRPRRRTAGRMGTLLAVGLALLAAGAVVVADSIDPFSVDVAVVAWAGALTVLAACLLFLGLAGRRSGVLGLFAVIALIGLTGASVASEIDGGEGTGRRVWVPTGQLSSYDYQLSAGEAVLDLRQLSPSAGTPVEVRADVSVGELVVRVPDDLTVAVDVTNGLGDVEGVVEGSSVLGPPGLPDVNLDIDVSVGSVVLQEVSR